MVFVENQGLQEIGGNENPDHADGVRRKPGTQDDYTAV